MGKQHKAFFEENEEQILERLKNAYQSFQKEYCEYGEDCFVSLTLYQAAVYDYFDSIEMGFERDLWGEFKQGYLILQLDPDINITSGILPVVLGYNLKKWPKPKS